MSNLADNGSIKNPYENFIALSRYARWDEEKGRREVWKETVDRLVSFFEEDLRERMNYDVSDDQLAEISDAVVSQNVMPSMRALMTAGPALKRNHIAAYNCAFIPVDSVRSFDEALLILMQGTGLGFSVESKNVGKLPEVAETFHDTDTTIVVGDSKEGWAKAYKELIAMIWAGNVPKWDMSNVRPAGARLKTFGGRASGPEPLNELFNHTVSVIKSAAGRRLKSVEAHSIMCKIAEVVVVGGVRRSALISLSDLDDYEMARAKSGAWWETKSHFGLANNSAVYDKKPSVEQFLNEWTSLIESKSGERGIFNLHAARSQTDILGRRDSSLIQGTNPCCVIATTSIMTTEGPREIQDLEGTPFTAIVDGKEYNAPHGSWISGVTTELVALKTREGYELELTPEHQILMDDGRTWKQAKDLVSGDKISLNQHKDVEWGSSDNYGDGYLLGLFVGDGNWANKETSTSRRMAQVKVWNDDDAESLIAPARSYAESLKKRSDWKGFVDKGDYQVMTIGALPYEYGISSTNKHDISALEENSSEFYKGFLRGIFDADGHVEGWDESKPNKGFSIRLGQSDYDLLLTVQRMLIRLGIKSTIAPLAPERMQSLPNGKGGMSEYKCQESWRLIISADHALEYVRRIGFNHKAKAAKCENVISWRKKIYKKPFVATVDSVDKVEGEYEVWDAEVSDVHAFDANGIYAHNSEINLRNNEFCNLTEVVVKPEDTLDDLKRKVELATILGTWQSTLTDIKYLRKSWKNNIEEERLLGVSLTGQFGHAVMNGSEGMARLGEWLEILREHAVETNKKEAARIGIPQSAAVTCVKPSGTVSQLCGVSSGMHPWHNDHYIRTVRGDNKDPITQLMKDMGIPNEPDVMNPDNTTVFSFPVKAPENAVTRKDVGAIEHLELWLAYQRHWCEHKPSVTISVKDEEWLDVGAWVYRHFDEVSGVSFLPYSDHTYQQAPYQDITEEEYNKAVAEMPENIDWTDLEFYEKEDTTTGSQELACSSGSCDVADLVSVDTIDEDENTSFVFSENYATM